MAESCGCGRGHGDNGLMIDARPGRYAGDERVGNVAWDPAALAVLERFGLNAAVCAPRSCGCRGSRPWT